MSFLKRLEYANKDFFMKLLKRFVKVPACESVDLSQEKSILFIRPDWIGDVVISTPVFRLVKQAYPAIRIGVLATASGCKVIQHDPHITELHQYNKKKPFSILVMLCKLRARKYNVVVNLIYVKSVTASLLTFLSVPKKSVRIRFTGGDDMDFLFSINKQQKILGNATKTMLEETVGICAVLGIDYAQADIRPHIYIEEKTKQKARDYFCTIKEDKTIAIGINLSARMAYREWNVANVNIFIERILSEITVAKVYIFAAPGSEKYVELHNIVKNDKVVFIPQMPNFMDIAAMVKHLHCLISPDTAMVHVASALQIPTIGLYVSSEKAILWRPFGVPYRTVVAENGDSATITPENVLSQTVSLLREIKQW